MSEFSRTFDLRHLPSSSQHLEADAAERAALAKRFALVAIDRLEAEIRLTAEGPAVRAAGRLTARIVQSCAVSGEDLPIAIDEPVALRFVAEDRAFDEGEEIELSAEDCDELPMQGGQFDLGEAIAQSLALAIDPYATGPQADAARARAGLLDPQASGPFAGLAAFRKDG
jgi:uncharacterized metal-binding protein YceD (DUF177 family)